MINTALPRTLATALCKTHNWVLVEQIGSGFCWCGTEDNMLHAGEKGELAEMLERIKAENHFWTLQALSEPAVGEDEIGLAMDLLFPLDVRAPLGNKATPKTILREYYRYVAKALALIGEQSYLRGYPNATFDVEPTPEMPNPITVNKYSLFLCDDKIEATSASGSEYIKIQSDTADNLWYNQAVKNLFPAKGYYQKFCGDANMMWFYNMAAITDRTGADVLFELELAALDDYLQSDSVSGSHSLYRVCCADEDLYSDLLLEEPDYKSRAIHSVSSLGQKMCALCNRPKSTMIHNIDITKNATGAKTELLRRHLNDAAAPFVQLGWEGAEWLH